MFVAVCAHLHDYVLIQNLNRVEKILLYGVIPKKTQLYLIAILKSLCASISYLVFGVLGPLFASTGTTKQSKRNKRSSSKEGVSYLFLDHTET